MSVQYTVENQPSCGECDHRGGGLYQPHEGETDWFMGLDSNGQAHYLCDNCKDGFFCVHPHGTSRASGVGVGGGGQGKDRP
jgi:hypothetical protein